MGGNGCLRSKQSHEDSIKNIKSSLSSKNINNRRQVFLDNTTLIQNIPVSSITQFEESGVFLGDKIHKSKYPCSCGGEKCKDEDWWQNKNPYIVGLNSSKITPNIIASQRPSTCLIRHYMLIKQFKL